MFLVNKQDDIAVCSGCCPVLLAVRQFEEFPLKSFHSFSTPPGGENHKEFEVSPG